MLAAVIAVKVFDILIRNEIITDSGIVKAKFLHKTLQTAEKNDRKIRLKRQEKTC